MAPLAFQLFLQLVQEAPLGAVRDDRLRARLDDADLLEPDGVKADRVARTVSAPEVVGNPMKASTVPWAKSSIPEAAGWMRKSMSFPGSRPIQAAMLETKACRPRLATETMRPFRSRTVRTPLVTNSS